MFCCCCCCQSESSIKKRQRTPHSLICKPIHHEPLFYFLAVAPAKLPSACHRHKATKKKHSLGKKNSRPHLAKPQVPQWVTTTKSNYSIQHTRRTAVQVRTTMISHQNSPLFFMIFIILFGASRVQNASVLWFVLFPAPPPLPPRALAGGVQGWVGKLQKNPRANETEQYISTFLLFHCV